MTTGSRAESASESRISRIVPVFISGVWLASDVPVTSDVSDDSVSVSVDSSASQSDSASDSEYTNPDSPDEEDNWTNFY